MAKVRLNKTNREFLKTHVMETIQVPELDAEIEKLEEPFLVELRKEHLKQYPTVEMRILSKYCSVALTKNITLNIISEEGGRSSFSKHPYELKNKVLNLSAYWFTNNGYTVTDKGSDLDLLNTKIIDLKKARRAALDKKHKDYYDLIDGSITFEAVAEIWEGALDIQDKFVSGKGLSVLNSEACARIRNETKKVMK